METEDDIETRVLPRVLRGPHARHALAALVAPAQRQLELDLRGVRRIDAYGGAVVRTAVSLHLARHPSGTVTMIEPARADTWGLTHNLLEGLPSRCAWRFPAASATPDGRVVQPAVCVTDPEMEELLTCLHLVHSCRGLKLADHEVHALQEAMEAFVDNAGEHAGDAAIPIVVCGGLEPQGNDLQLAAVDLGTSIAAADDGEAMLRNAVGRSRDGSGALHWLARAKRGHLDVSMRIASGTGRAWSRSGQSWHFSSGPRIPGFIVGFEIHR